ncbi:MAG: helix-turn-helix domain-containing protein [Lachnospiraceae bacterium]|nr:helix-turn-helix domain-containing protein [Lachnospiraceae bacterium]
MENLLENYPLFLSTNDVATILGVTPRTVRHLVNTGKIYSLRIGNLIRIPKDSLISYLYENKRRT